MVAVACVLSLFTVWWLWCIHSCIRSGGGGRGTPNKCENDCFFFSTMGNGNNRVLRCRYLVVVELAFWKSECVGGLECVAFFAGVEEVVVE